MHHRTRYNEEIISYYERSGWLYKTFWYGRESLGLHFGIDDEERKGADQPLINTYKIIIEKGGIKRGMRVLDAGCGVGGAVLYIASQTGAQVEGITLVGDQAFRAEYYKKRKGIVLANFSVQDYTSTNFADDYFDVVYGVESVCYAYPKNDFLTEAYRILKPGGKLIIIDGYNKRNPTSDQEKTIEKDFCRGWKLKEMITISNMQKAIKEVGFNHNTIEDLTPRIGGTLARFEWLWRIGSMALFLPGVKDNVMAIKNVIAGVKRGLFGYYLIVATKS